MYPQSAVLTAFCKKDMSPAQPEACLPPNLSSLCDPKYKSFTPAVIAEECVRIFSNGMKVKEADVKYLPDATKLQSMSIVWHQHRIGRLTASRFGSICHTNCDSPSRSLVASILSPQPLSTPAIKWGIEKEATARETYHRLMLEKHDSFNLESTGLHVNPSCPHLEASPDGLISCSCCSEGVLEIKCPYSIRDQEPTAASYLDHSDSGVTLSTTHHYYFQIQGQKYVIVHIVTSRVGHPMVCMCSELLGILNFVRPCRSSWIHFL